MLTQAISLIVATVSMQGGAAATPAQAESAKLNRVYKSGDTDTHSVTAKIQEGMEINLTASLLLKVLEEPKDSKVGAELSCPKMTVDAGGPDIPAPETLKVKLSKNGMPDELDIKDANWIYALFCASGYLPAADVEKGKEFNINWSVSKATMFGKGHLVDIVTEDGNKVAVIKYKIRVTPQEDDPGDVEATSRIDIATGKLLKSEGKVTVGENMVASFTVKKVAKTDK